MTVDTRSAARRVEEDLLARLGLDRGANPLAVESARDGIVAYLSKAPSEIRSWADREITVVDEAFAILSDPTADLAEYAASLAAGAPAANAAPTATAGAANAPLDPVAAAYAARRVKRSRNPFSRLNPLAKAVVSGVAVVAIVAGAYLVYQSGATTVPPISGSAAPEASASGAQIDQAQLASLMQKITANPKDSASLQSIADLYFQAGDYANSIVFEQKVIALEPNNVTAHLSLGASAFNNGDTATAATEWKKVVALDAKNVEAHYDLGYMYLSQNPPDMTNVKAEWNAVIALAPDSDIAKNVKTHLDSFASASLEPSAGTSAAPAGSSAPSASPAPSPSN